MSGQNKYPVTPEEVMMQIEVFSNIIKKMERPSEIYLNHFKQFLIEHGEEKTKKLLEKTEGIEKLPFDISAADFLLLLSNIGTPAK